ncbi:MAG: 16S rRNA (uracil(1498)-N(3))-methyltransferase [Planctomycetaceae bacterium]|nr:16S rRNA (uracil(1498)-N(3))-methyltransferase [Planctomycetaceae bacterium]
MHRFYAPQSLDGGAVDLEGDEAAHLTRVLRLGVGTQVTLFDGKGSSALAEIQEIRKRSVRLAVTEPLPPTTASGPQLTLLTAAPKVDRFRWLVEKATELGVARLIPIRTERSVVHPGEGKRDKMEAAVIAACKQCGRNDLMALDTLCPWNEALSLVGDNRLLVADPRGRSLRGMDLPHDHPSRLLIAVGPEGGFTPHELELAEAAGGQRISLGANILRIETAAVALAAWARFQSSV